MLLNSDLYISYPKKTGKVVTNFIEIPKNDNPKSLKQSINNSPS